MKLIFKNWTLWWLKTFFCGVNPRILLSKTVLGLNKLYLITHWDQKLNLRLKSYSNLYIIGFFGAPYESSLEGTFIDIDKVLVLNKHSLTKDQDHIFLVVPSRNPYGTYIAHLWTRQTYLHTKFGVNRIEIANFTV